MFIFLITLISASFGQNSNLAQLDGEWYSDVWKYGYKLTNGVGIATSTNSPNFKVGDRIIILKELSNNIFQGEQVYKDGKFYKITVTPQSNDTLFFRGERNVTWTMTRKGHVNNHEKNNIATSSDTPFVTSAPLSSTLTSHSKLPPCVTYWHMCTGTKTLSYGGKYVGEFKDGKFNGKGTVTEADGRKYVGEFKDGYLNGKVTLSLADGSTYVGEYKDGYLNGKVTSSFADGSTYVGEYKDGYLNGKVTSSFADGSTYVGEYKHGRRNGLGIFTFADGAKYVGEFKDGKPNGIGSEIDSRGLLVRTGRWVDGIFSLIVSPSTVFITSDQMTLAERAKQGNAQAQFDYGMTFIAETNVEIQPRIALKWFSESAKQGYGPAQRQIESMFDLGARMSVMESSIQLK